MSVLVRRERMMWRPRVVVEKWDLEQIAYAERIVRALRGADVPWRPNRKDLHLFGGRPEVAEHEGNIVTDWGTALTASLLTGSGGQALAVGALRVGVGDASSPAEDAADTDLAASAGSTHRWFEPADSVSVTDAEITVVATFGTADANFLWDEWGWDVGTPTVGSGSTVNSLYNHKTGTGGSLGTKTSSYAWAYTSYVDLA